MRVWGVASGHAALTMEICVDTAGVSWPVDTPIAKTVRRWSAACLISRETFALPFTAAAVT